MESSDTFLGLVGFCLRRLVCLRMAWRYHNDTVRGTNFFPGVWGKDPKIDGHPLTTVECSARDTKEH